MKPSPRPSILRRFLRFTWISRLPIWQSGQFDWGRLFARKPSNARIARTSFRPGLETCETRKAPGSVLDIAIATMASASIVGVSGLLAEEGSNPPAAPPVKPDSDPPGRRLSDDDLAALFSAVPPSGGGVDADNSSLPQGPAINPPVMASPLDVALSSPLEAEPYQLPDPTAAPTDQAATPLAT